MKRALNEGAPFGNKVRRLYKAKRSPRMTATQYSRALVSRARGFIRSGGNYRRYGSAATAVGLKPELKWLDTSINDTVPNATEVVPTPTSLNLMSQGNTASTREGNKIIIKRISVALSLVYDPVATNTYNNIEIWLMQDTQCNGAAATWDDVANNANITRAMMDLAYTQRFRIIKRFKVTFNNTAGVDGAYAPQCKSIRWSKKVNIPIDYATNNGDITDIKSNNLFLVWGCWGGTDATTVTGYFRIRYYG